MDRLAEVVEIMLGRPAQPAEFSVTDVPYDSGSPATGALQRLRGTTTDGERFSCFLKVLHHVRHWPKLHYVPEGMREQFANDFPWRGELAMWEPDFAGRLLEGLRVPRLYLIEELGDDRLRVWMEDIDEATAAWGPDTFRRAARALGGFAARRGDAELLDRAEMPVGFGLRMYVNTRVKLASGPALHDDTVWEHPLIRDAVDDKLRADLLALFGEVDAMLDRLDALPQAMPHGDASPQNLLVPTGDPETLVSIDISFQCPLAVGFDLGQLLIGLVHAGQMPAEQLAATHDAILPSFVEGYHDHGGRASAGEMAQGYILSLMARAGFTSLPFELLGAPATPESVAMFRERAALTRFIVDLAKHL